MILSLQNGSVRFPSRVSGGSDVHALRDVSLSIAKGERVGLVGESGSGKSTLARVMMGVEKLHSGALLFEDRPVPTLGRVDYLRYRSRCQMVFQDPAAALDPRQSVLKSIIEPLEIQRRGNAAERRRRAINEAERVGLSEQIVKRRPGSLSGGQLQRAAIARALVLDPDLILLDEAVSALDVSVQAQILQLLEELQRERELAYLFISHDLSVIESVTQRVAVMYQGRIIEMGDTAEVLANPHHPYSAELLRAVPRIDRSGKLTALFAGGGVALTPDVAVPPEGGCAYQPRCPRAESDCLAAVPPLDGFGDATNRLAACFHPQPDATPIATPNAIERTS